MPRTASLENQLQLEITDLKRQAATLNHPDTFAQSAKAERKALALEKELLRLQENYAAKQASMILKVPGALRAVSTVVLAVLVMRLPVVAFMRPEAVWPLGRWLAMLSRQPQDVGAVGVLPWALLCHRVTKAALGRVPR